MKKWILDKEKELVKTLLKRKLAGEGKEAPSDSRLDKEAEKVVNDANRIFKDSGKKVLKDLKQTAKGFWKEAKKK